MTLFAFIGNMSIAVILIAFFHSIFFMWDLTFIEKLVIYFFGFVISIIITSLLFFAYLIVTIIFKI